MEHPEGLKRVDRLLEYLASDGDWHSLVECARVLGAGLDTAREVVRLLASVGLLDYDERREVAKISPGLAEFITGDR